MFKSNISAVRQRLAARKSEVKTSVAQVMQPIEWESEMVAVARGAIEIAAPVEHRYLVPALSGMIQSDVMQGGMKFFIEYPPSSGITHSVQTWGNESEQLRALKALKMDQIIYWISSGMKDLTAADERRPDEDETAWHDRIAATIWIAIHGEEGKPGNPDVFINPGSHKGHDPKTSLLAVGGFYGASLSDAVVVSGVLAAVLEAWKAHMAVAIPLRVKRTISGEAANEPF